MSDVRERILRASVELVEARGVRGVSFREVARRAGVSHQTPYHLVGNHLGILRAIADEGFGRLADVMASAAAEAGPDPVPALVAAGLAYVDFARDNPGYFKVMFASDLVDIHDPEAPMQGADRTHATFLSLCRGAHSAGRGAGLALHQLTLMAWSIVHGVAALLVEGVFARREELTPDAERALAAQVVEGLANLLSDRR